MSKPPNKRQHLLPDRFRHPAAIARDQFFETNCGICLAHTLGTENPNYYLGNRLEIAFEAGWSAAKAHYLHMAEVKGLKLPL